jgi:trigger factor
VKSRQGVIVLVAGVVVIVAVAAVILTLVLVIGKSGEDEFESDLVGGDSGRTVDGYEEYISLGEYKGVEVDYRVPDVAGISEQEVQDEMDVRVAEFDVYNDVTGRGVQKGDLVNVDFVGKLDGVTLEGMAAEGEEFVVGDGGYVEDFEMGVVGMLAGQSGEIDVLFPKDYEEDEELAGKRTVFAVTVNSIQEVVPAVLTEDFVKENFGMDSIAAWQETIREELLQAEQDSSREQMYADLVSRVMENSKLLDYPQEMYDRVFAELQVEMQEEADMYGMTLQDYLSMWYGEDEISKEWVEERILENGIKALIVQREGIVVADEEYDRLIDDNLADFAVESKEELESLYTPEDIMAFLVDLKFQDFLIGAAVVTELAAVDYDAKYETDDSAAE